MLLSSPPVDKRGPHLTRMTPTASSIDASTSADTSILSARYRATTIGMVALVALLSGLVAMRGLMRADPSMLLR